jgi:hypothetical protein
MWFREVDTIQSPGVPELRVFVEGVVNFLGAVIEDREAFGFLWQGSEDLREQSADTFAQDVRPEANRLISELGRLSLSAMRAHGLDGRALRYKLRVVNTVAGLRPAMNTTTEVRDWLRRILTAIDALLDSIIDAAGGVGGLIRGFKDSLAALA